MTARSGVNDSSGHETPPVPVRCAVLTISDRASRGEYADQSGPEIARILASWGWAAEVLEVLPDDKSRIEERLAALADSGLDCIVTTGGTGLSMRDRTPEATLRAADRLAPGIMEAVRARTGTQSPLAYLSRGIAAMRGRCLLVNLPGSVRGASESIHALADLLPHAIGVLRGDPGIQKQHDSMSAGESRRPPGAARGGAE